MVDLNAVLGTNSTSDVTDGHTTIHLTKVGVGTAVVISGVSDAFALGGAFNTLDNYSSALNGPTAISNSTISLTVDGEIVGSNRLSLTNLNASTVSFVDEGTLGGDHVVIANVGGQNVVSIAGPNDTISLNGDAHNVVTLGGGGAVLTVGFADDNTFAAHNPLGSTRLSLAGANDSIVGGDENFSISGSAGASRFTLGDGSNSVQAGGANNAIVVGGGINSISAGGGGSKVLIEGVDFSNSKTFSPDVADAGVPASPSDRVTITGSGDTVGATYENIAVTGVAVSASTIALGDGANFVALSGAGYNDISAGDGANAISVAGVLNTVTVGDGANTISLGGSTDWVWVEDKTGAGRDAVNVGSGVGDVVNLGAAGGSVTGVGPGVTTVIQTGGATVNVDLGSGAGHLSLGDGAESVFVQGGHSAIKLGGGANFVSADGAYDQITLGGGGDTVFANGDHDSLSLGDGPSAVFVGGAQDAVLLGSGADTVIANGDSDTITLGDGGDTLFAGGAGDNLSLGNGTDAVVVSGNSATGVFGSGAGEAGLMLTALGSGDAFVATGLIGSTNEVTLGANDSFTLEGAKGSGNGGALTATLAGAQDTITLDNNMRVGTSVAAAADLEKIVFKNNAGGVVTLDEGVKTETLDILGNATGGEIRKIDVYGFAGGDLLDLHGLKDASGAALVNSAQVIGELAKNSSPEAEVLSLLGGGSITFHSPTVIMANDISFA